MEEDVRNIISTSETFSTKELVQPPPRKASAERPPRPRASTTSPSSSSPPIPLDTPRQHIRALTRTPPPLSDSPETSNLMYGMPVPQSPLPYRRDTISPISPGFPSSNSSTPPVIRDANVSPRVNLFGSNQSLETMGSLPSLPPWMSEATMNLTVSSSGTPWAEGGYTIGGTSPPVAAPQNEERRSRGGEMGENADSTTTSNIAKAMPWKSMTPGKPPLYHVDKKENSSLRPTTETFEGPGEDYKVKLENVRLEVQKLKYRPEFDQVRKDGCQLKGSYVFCGRDDRSKYLAHRR